MFLRKLVTAVKKLMQNLVKAILYKLTYFYIYTSQEKLPKVAFVLLQLVYTQHTKTLNIQLQTTGTPRLKIDTDSYLAERYV